MYTYQSGQHVTPQSAVDTNLNGDSAPDRVIINPAGNPNLGTTASALPNSAGATVAYLVTDPAAKFVAAPKGTLSNGGRSILNLNPIDSIDVTLAKRFSITERFKLEFSARAINVFNHPQYTGGYLNDVAAFGPPGGIGGGAGYAAGTAPGILARSAITPGSSIFQQWSQAFSSNPRYVQLVLKVIF